MCKISSHLHCLLFFRAGVIVFSGRQSVMLRKLAKITNIAKLKYCNVLYSARKILYILPDFFHRKNVGELQPQPAYYAYGAPPECNDWGAYCRKSMWDIYFLHGRRQNFLLVSGAKYKA